MKTYTIFTKSGSAKANKALKQADAVKLRRLAFGVRRYRRKACKKHQKV